MLLYYIYLSEVSKEDFIKGRAIKLDKEGKWYVSSGGKYNSLRHTKILFDTKKLQNKCCKEYRLHDPTKVQDKCIEVLLCKDENGKFKAISTLRKLDLNCMLKHPETYAKVPKNVFIKAVKNTSVLSDEEKKKMIKVFNIIKRKYGDMVNRKKDEIKYVKSVREFNKI